MNISEDSFRHDLFFASVSLSDAKKRIISKVINDAWGKFSDNDHMIKWVEVSISMELYSCIQK